MMSMRKPLFGLLALLFGMLIMANHSTSGLSQAEAASSIPGVFGASTQVQGDNKSNAQVPLTTSFQDGVLPTSGYVGTNDTSVVEIDPNTNVGALNVCAVDGDDPSGSGLETSVILMWDVVSGIWCVDSGPG